MLTPLKQAEVAMLAIERVADDLEDLSLKLRIDFNLGLLEAAIKDIQHDQK